MGDGGASCFCRRMLAWDEECTKGATGDLAIVSAGCAGEYDEPMPILPRVRRGDGGRVCECFVLVVSVGQLSHITRKKKGLCVTYEEGPECHHSLKPMVGQ